MMECGSTILNRHILAYAVAFTCLAVLVTGTANADEVPFFANSNVPDYSAWMNVWRGHGRPQPYSRSVVHHNGLTHVEETNDGRSEIYYGNFFGNVVLQAEKNAAGDFTSFRVNTTATQGGYLDLRGSRLTVESDSQAGERCRWWEIVRQSLQDRQQSGPLWFSCLSGDGIEVATKVLFSDGTPMAKTQLVKLVRRPVADSEVNPPAILFDPGFWLKPFRQYSAKPATAADFEASMVGRNSEIKLLRHYPWRSEEFRGKDGSSRFMVWNELENQGIRVYSSKGHQHLDASRRPLNPKSPWDSFDHTTGRVDLNKSESLEESCAWFDMMPNVADAGRRQCLTADGIPLRDVITSGWGGGETYEAVSIKRRSVDLKEMIAPLELLDPSKWGFSVAN